MLEVTQKPQKHKGHVQSHCVPMQTKEEGKTMDLRGLGRDEWLRGGGLLHKTAQQPPLEVCPTQDCVWSPDSGQWTNQLERRKDNIHCLWYFWHSLFSVWIMWHQTDGWPVKPKWSRNWTPMMERWRAQPVMFPNWHECADTRLGNLTNHKRRWA